MYLIFSVICAKNGVSIKRSINLQANIAIFSVFSFKYYDFFLTTCI